MFRCETLLLHPDRPLRLDPARHAELRVESGMVWITASGAAGDLFLVAGERYSIPEQGRVLVESLRAAAGVSLHGRRRRRIPELVESWRALLPRGMAMP